jgi:hypothetical protein
VIKNKSSKFLLFSPYANFSIVQWRLINMNNINAYVSTYAYPVGMRIFLPHLKLVLMDLHKQEFNYNN